MQLKIPVFYRNRAFGGIDREYFTVEKGGLSDETCDKNV